MFLLPRGGDELVRSIISSFWVGFAVNGTHCLSFCVVLWIGLTTVQAGNRIDEGMLCKCSLRTELSPS